MSRHIAKALVCLAALTGCAAGPGLVPPIHAPPLPDGWVDLHQIDPTIRLDMRYATSNNFTGRRVPGYRAARCLLARPAAQALVSVQQQLATTGETLVVFDCYRPARSVTSFVAWVGSSDRDNRHYYPGLARNSLIDRGYIAARSGHSRGYTVDLAIGPASVVSRTARRTSACGRRTDVWTHDFGTPFDCFHPSSGSASSDVSSEATSNRQRLAGLMNEAGFAGYSEEWWHFTLQPRPDDAPWLDFEIR